MVPRTANDDHAVIGRAHAVAPAGCFTRPDVLYRSGAAMPETVAFGACLHDVAVAHQPVQQSRGHLCVTEHAGPFGEVEICCICVELNVFTINVCFLLASQLDPVSAWSHGAGAYGLWLSDRLLYLRVRRRSAVFPTAFVSWSSSIASGRRATIPSERGSHVSGVFSTLRKKHQGRCSPRTAYRRNVAWLMTVSRTLASPSVA